MILTDYNITFSTSVIGGVKRFYKRDKNYFVFTRKTTSKETGEVRLSLQIGDYTLNYTSTADGSIEADITNVLRQYANSVTITAVVGDGEDSDSETFVLAEGMNPKVAHDCIIKMMQECDLAGDTKAVNTIALPTTILRKGAIVQTQLYNSNVTDGDTWEGATWVNDILSIHTTSQSFSQKNGNEVLNTWATKATEEGKRYAWLSLDSLFGKRNGTDKAHLNIVVEVRGIDEEYAYTELQSLGSGSERRITSAIISAKIGLSDLTAYDYAYYSTFILSAESCSLIVSDELATSVTTYKAIVTTKKVTIKQGAVGKYDLEISLKMYAND